MGKLTSHATRDSSAVADAEEQVTSLFDGLMARIASRIERQTAEDPFAQITLLAKLITALDASAPETALADALSGAPQDGTAPAALPGSTGGNPTDTAGRRQAVVAALKAMRDNGELGPNQVLLISGAIETPGSPSFIEADSSGQPIALANANRDLQTARDASDLKEKQVTGLLKGIGAERRLLAVNASASDAERIGAQIAATLRGSDSTDAVAKPQVTTALDAIEAGIRGLSVDRVRGTITNTEALRSAIANARGMVS